MKLLNIPHSFSPPKKLKLINLAESGRMLQEKGYSWTIFSKESFRTCHIDKRGKK